MNVPLYTKEHEFDAGLVKAIKILDTHYNAFTVAKVYADETGHTVPSDTKSWSEILVSVLTGLEGRGRQKGSDLRDGSDVKAANVWSAIDTPRFNGVLPAGRTTAAAKKPDDVTALDATPFLFFVLWDRKPPEGLPRCRIWTVRPQRDRRFRELAATWYEKRKTGEITSTNFQLHPPRNLNSNVIRNSCGNLSYPLLLAAVHREEGYELETFEPSVLRNGQCSRA